MQDLKLDGWKELVGCWYLVDADEVLRNFCELEGIGYKVAKMVEEVGEVSGVRYKNMFYVYFDLGRVSTPDNSRYLRFWIGVSDRWKDEIGGSSLWDEGLYDG